MGAHCDLDRLPRLIRCLSERLRPRAEEDRTLPYPAWPAMQLTPAHLQYLIDEGKSLLGPHFEPLRAKHLRGRLRDPHRLVVLILRAETMLSAWQREGRLTLDGTTTITVMELSNVVRLLTAARQVPEFAHVEATIRTSDDYHHALVLLQAKWFLEELGNGEVEYVPTATSPMPDLVLRGKPVPLYVEVCVPRMLVRPPFGLVTSDAAVKTVTAVLNRKKKQLRGRESMLLLGGLHCNEASVNALRKSLAHDLPRRNRPQLVGVGIFATFIATEYRGDARTRARLHNASHTAFVLNPGYLGPINIASGIPPEAPLKPVTLTTQAMPVPVLPAA